MRGVRGPGVWFEAGGRPALVLRKLNGSDPRYLWSARLVGRSDGGFNVGNGPTPGQAIDDLVRRYKACIEAVESGRQELRAMGELIEPKQPSRRSPTK